MPRYYTRVCNFYYGLRSKDLIKKKRTLPLNGNNQISFDEVEIISRKSKKRIPINKIDSLPIYLIKKIKKDLNLVKKKKEIQSYKF